MFVQANTLGDIKDYFRSELSSVFSESEIKSIIKEVAINRLNINSVEYISSSSLKLSESDLLHFRSVVKRLQNEEPFQYIIGHTWFYDLQLKVDERALIPRPETEELVDWVIGDYRSMSSVKIMDVCSGSGCIALALKSVLIDSEMSALEFSEEAISLIEENSKETDLELKIVNANALIANDYKQFQQESFDCWVSNPPYIPEKEKVLMAKNVLEHEPEMALFVDDNDPLIFYREIAVNALLYLKVGGALYFEIHEDLAEETSSLLEGLGFVNIEVRKDLQGKDRMVKALKVSSRHESE